MGMEKKKRKKRKRKRKQRADIRTQLLVTTSISSLLATYSDKIGFFADNNTDSCDFVFSDDLFSSLFVTFSDEMCFVTNSVLSITFSDENFCHKKLKLLVTK